MNNAERSALSTALSALAANPRLMEVGRLAVEDVLIELRDARIGVLGRNNGLVCRERDGTESTVIRLPIEVAVAIALKAIAKEISHEQTQTA